MAATAKHGTYYFRLFSSEVISWILVPSFEVPPDQGLQLLISHVLGGDAVIEQLTLHPGPHALTAGVVMTAATVAVHALADGSYSAWLIGAWLGIATLCQWPLRTPHIAGGSSA